VAGKQAAPGQEGMALWGTVAGVGHREAAMTNAWQQGSSVCSTSEPRLACGTPNYSLVSGCCTTGGEKEGNKRNEVTHVGETQKPQEK